MTYAVVGKFDKRKGLKLARDERKECQCSMRIKLVGDGCPVCNPDYWEQFKEPEGAEAGRRE